MIISYPFFGSKNLRERLRYRTFKNVLLPTRNIFMIRIWDFVRYVTLSMIPCTAVLLVNLFLPISADAQLWGRAQRQQQSSHERILPPENTYATPQRGPVNVEPSPEISNSAQNTSVKTFDQFDVFPAKSDLRTPNGGISASAAIVNLSIQDIVEGIGARSLNQRYNQWRSYLAGVMRNTDGVRSGSEINGLGRLSWFKSIMADPLKGAGEADEFTRYVHVNLCLGRLGFCKALKKVASRMDIDDSGIRIPEYFSGSDSTKALASLEKALVDTLLSHGRAIAPLSQDQLKLISNYAHRILTIEASVGHTVSMRGSGKQQILAMQAIDQSAMYQGLEDLSLLMDPIFIKAIDSIKDENSELTYEGVTGTISKIIETQAGIILIGGRNPNLYDIEKMPNVCCIIDLGGNDTYVEGAVNLKRPVLGILDLHGDDVYRGSLPGIQGSCILGISLLVDVEGDDKYVAKHHAQASAMGGACALIDYDGNDSYDGVRRLQGTAVCGIGILVDRRGNDRYHAAMWSQGMGQPLGCGILEDCTGDDTYYTGGMYFDSYPDTPGYEGWGQGLGTGIRGVAAGGIGMLLEGEGDDRYEYDYIAHGGGYWMGLGFLRDFAGNDIHQGSTSVMWDGSPRREPKFQRFSSGFGCHYAAGFFFEDTGNDTYWASIMSEGFAWDCGVAFLYDHAGDDTITGAGSGNQGQGAQASLGVLVNFAGNDTYKGSSQGYASGNITYHDLPNCGGNFSFLFDYGGTDVYGCRARNNASIRRGTNGGFLTDRPTKAELAEAEAAKAKAEAEAKANTAQAQQTAPIQR